MNKWNVYRGRKFVTCVYFDKDCTMAYVCQSLVNHDGLPSDISVVRG